MTAVVLRPYRRQDAPALRDAAVQSAAEVAPWLPWCHPAYSIADALGWIERCEATRAEGTEYHFAILDPAGEFLGACGLNRLEPEHRMANLGYWVRTSATGRGVATAAARELAAFAFRETSLIRLELVVALGNAASHRVAAKLGAVREGLAHDRLLVGERAHDAIVYALLRSRHRP